MTHNLQKTAVFVLLTSSLLLTAACSKTVSGDMSQACLDYTKQTKELMSEHPQLSAMFDKFTEQTKESWGNMSQDEQAQVTAKCEEGLRQLEEVKKMQPQ